MGSTLWEGPRIADGVAKLCRRRAITVKLGTDGDALGSRWLLKHPNAAEMLPEPSLIGLWYEVMHLDAAHIGFVPVIKFPFRDGMAADEYRQLHDPGNTPNVFSRKNTATDVLFKDFRFGGSLPVIYIERHHPSRGRSDEAIFYKFYNHLESKDLPFIKRFYDLVSQSRPKVYRVPKGMEAAAITYRAISSLAAP